MDKQRTIFDLHNDPDNRLIFNCDNCRDAVCLIMAVPGLMLCITCISRGEFSETSADGYTVPRNPNEYED